MPSWRIRAAIDGSEVSDRSNVVLCRLNGGPTSELIGHLRTAIDACTVPAVVVVYATATAKLPDAHARREAARLMAERGPQIEAWVVILEGNGFLRSAFRSVASTVRLMARPAFPLQIVSTPHAAVHWLSNKTTAKLTVEDLTQHGEAPTRPGG